MSKSLPFLVYCIELYKTEKNMTGKSVIELFSKHNVIDYIISSYGALHTTGKEYTIADIDAFITENS